MSVEGASHGRGHTAIEAMMVGTQDAVEGHHARVAAVVLVVMLHGRVVLHSLVVCVAELDGRDRKGGLVLGGSLGEDVVEVEVAHVWRRVRGQLGGVAVVTMEGVHVHAKPWLEVEPQGAVLGSS